MKVNRGEDRDRGTGELVTRRVKASDQDVPWCCLLAMYSWLLAHMNITSRTGAAGVVKHMYKQVSEAPPGESHPRRASVWAPAEGRQGPALLTATLKGFVMHTKDGDLASGCCRLSKLCRLQSSQSEHIKVWPSFLASLEKHPGHFLHGT